VSQMPPKPRAPLAEVSANKVARQSLLPFTSSKSSAPGAAPAAPALPPTTTRPVSRTLKELHEVTWQTARRTVQRLVDGYQDRSGSGYGAAVSNSKGCLLVQKAPNRQVSRGLFPRNYCGVGDTDKTVRKMDIFRSPPSPPWRLSVDPMDSRETSPSPKTPTVWPLSPINQTRKSDDYCTTTGSRHPTFAMSRHASIPNTSPWKAKRPTRYARDVHVGSWW
jgi:hypothetical protein